MTVATRRIAHKLTAGAKRERSSGGEVLKSANQGQLHSTLPAPECPRYGPVGGVRRYEVCSANIALKRFGECPQVAQDLLGRALVLTRRFGLPISPLDQPLPSMSCRLCSAFDANNCRFSGL